MTTETRLQPLAEGYRYAFEYHRDCAVSAIAVWRHVDTQNNRNKVWEHCEEAIYWHKRWYDEVRNANNRTV